MQWIDPQPSYSIARSFTFSRLQLGCIYTTGVLLAVLIGFLSVAITGYELHPIYTADVNGTADSPEWFQGSPFSWAGSQQTSCQDSLLHIGDSYITKNLGFRYSLERIRTQDDVAAELSYRDQTLEKCRVSRIAINLARRDNAKQAGKWWTWSAMTAYATIDCQIATTNPHNITLRTTLPAPIEDGIINSFLTPSGTPRQAMWYGVNLMNAWYEQISRAMSYSAPFTSSWASGRISLARNPAEDDFNSLDFFKVAYGQERQDGAFPNFGGITLKDWAHGTHPRLPNISASVDAFGKAFYGVIMADLGMESLTHEKLQYLQEYKDEVSLNASRSCQKKDVCGAGAIQNLTGLDNLNPTVATQLSSQYLCLVPELKDAISIVYSLVLAEIVFLHGCWALFVLSAAWHKRRKQSMADHCVGCDEQRKSQDDQERRMEEGRAASDESSSDGGRSLRMLKAASATW